MDGVRVRPVWLLPALIAVTLLGACGIFLDLGAMVMSPMLFDSGESSWAWAMFTGIWLSPLLVIVSVALGWIGFGTRVSGLAMAGIVVAAMPLIVGLSVFLPVWMS